MGNHSIGQTMDRAAQKAAAARSPDETALQILDRICEPFRGQDAEFESTHPDDPTRVHPDFDSSLHPHPKAALGMLLMEAFAPNGIGDLPRYASMLSDASTPEADVACDAWWEEVREPFKSRYNFF